MRFGVLLEVIFEGIFLRKRFATAVTLEGMNATVDAPVHDQVADAGVRFLADLTTHPIARV